MPEKYKSDDKSRYGFTSPATGEKYTSENPISKHARENTLFIEKLRPLESLPRALGIRSAFLNAGPENVAEFEKLLSLHNKGLQDLLSLSTNNIAPVEKDECSQYISEFFTTASVERKKQLAGFIAALLG